MSSAQNDQIEVLYAHQPLIAKILSVTIHIGFICVIYQIAHDDHSHHDSDDDHDDDDDDELKQIQVWRQSK